MAARSSVRGSAAPAPLKRALAASLLAAATFSAATFPAATFPAAVAARAPAAGGGTAAAPAGAPLYTRSGDAASARWVGFDAAGAPVFLCGTERRSAPWSGLVRYGRVRPVQLRSGQVLASLAGGGRMVGRISSLDAKQLVLENAALGVVRLPRAEVAAIWLRLRFEPQGRDERTAEILASGGERDALFLEDGDRRSGKVLAWEVPPPDEIRSPGAKFAVEVDGQTTRIEAAEVEVVRLASTKKSAAKEPPQAIWVGLADGSVFPAASVAPDSTSVDGALIRPAYAPAAEPWKLFAHARAALLQPRGYGTAYLSDLPIVKPRQVPLWNEALPPQADRNVLGRALRSGGSEYLKGLGASGALALSYPIRPEQKKFQALAVLDDEAGLGGSVTLQVLVDGKSRYTSPIVRGGDPAAPVSVDVAGGKILTLVVLFADRGPVLDYLDLIDARLSE